MYIKKNVNALKIKIKIKRDNTYKEKIKEEEELRQKTSHLYGGWDCGDDSVIDGGWDFFYHIERRNDEI